MYRMACSAIMVIGLCAVTHGQMSLIPYAQSWCAISSYPRNIGFFVTVVNGTPPYTYVWQGGQTTYTSNLPDAGYSMSINSPGGYTAHVLVTDGTSQSASITIPSEMCYVGECAIQRVPYLSGTPPLFTYTESIIGCQNETFTGLVPYGTSGYYTTGPGYDVGEYVYASCGPLCQSMPDCYGGCGVAVHPPSVLPEWMVLDVQGACANGAGGSIQVGVQPTSWPFGVG